MSIQPRYPMSVGEKRQLTLAIVAVVTFWPFTRSSCVGYASTEDPTVGSNDAHLAKKSSPFSVWKRHRYWNEFIVWGAKWWMGKDQGRALTRYYSSKEGRGSS